MNEQSTFRHAVKWAYVLTGAQRGIAMLLTFVLAIVLGPKDFGIAAMAMAYIIFIEMLVAQGMGAAIIQRKDLSSEQLDSIFWLVGAASLVLVAVSIALSQWWASVNALPTLAPVIIVLSLSIPIKGLTVVQHALLQRKMDFRNLALLSGGSAIVGGAVGVVMALNGYGIWSLVAQHLVGSALATAVMWKVSDWRPRFRFSWRRAREMFGFSGGVFFSHLGVYAAGQSDAILMGLFFGPVAVGVYRLGERVMDMLLEVATRSIQIVALPHFSSLQDDPQRLRAAVASCLRLSATLTIPAMAILALSSDELMGMLGAKWAPASIVLKIVVFMGMAKALTVFSGPLLLAKGYAKALAVLTWVLAIVFGGLITGCGIAFKDASLQTQVIAVAIARTGAYLLLGGLVRLLIIRFLCKLSFGSIARAVAPGVIAAIGAAATAMLILEFVVRSTTPAITAFALVVGPAGLAAVALLAIFDRAVREVLFHPLRWSPKRTNEVTQRALHSQVD